MKAIERANHEANNVKFDVLELQKGSVLFEEGERSQNIYVLVTGQLAVMKNGESGVVRIATIYAKQMIGEMAFLNKEARSATIIADQYTQVIKLNLGDPESFIKEIIETLIKRTQTMNEDLLNK
jgi:CRP/FNR family cyclic AMP-dependent transcriptional regulator